MAQNNFPRGTQNGTGSSGTGSGGAAGRYIQHNRIREVTNDQTSEARLREQAQLRQAQRQSAPPKGDGSSKP
jgi:hypothetical protein